jgi:hypothetical protein
MLLLLNFAAFATTTTLANRLETFDWRGRAGGAIHLTLANRLLEVAQAVRRQCNDLTWVDFATRQATVAAGTQDAIAIAATLRKCSVSSQVNRFTLVVRADRNQIGVGETWTRWTWLVGLAYAFAVHVRLAKRDCDNVRKAGLAADATTGALSKNALC